MKVYHGSDTQIEQINLNKCKLGKDFGQGFYVTKLQEQAVTMAERVSRWSRKTPLKSLQALSQSKGKIDIAIYGIGDNVVQSLMIDYDMNELDATDRYYTSNTYAQLANESTELYKKTWQEIYELVKQELK